MKPYHIDGENKNDKKKYSDYGSKYDIFARANTSFNVCLKKELINKGITLSPAEFY